MQTDIMSTSVPPPAGQGLSNPEIGTSMGISRRTAETQRANRLRKLGLKGQQDIIRDALKRGLLER